VYNKKFDVTDWAKKMNALAGPEVRLMLNSTKIKKSIAIGNNSVTIKSAQL